MQAKQALQKRDLFFFKFCVNIHKRHKDEAVERDDEVINLN